MVATHEIGPLEMQVLGLLSEGEPRSVAMIQEQLGAAGAELAYTTVMTVLVRLQKKGLAVRHKEGNRYLYAASRSGPAVGEGMIERLRRTLFQGDRTRPILALLDDRGLSDDELRTLRKAIDQRLKGGKR
jgi:predicted transcriptional regulator